MEGREAAVANGRTGSVRPTSPHTPFGRFSYVFSSTLHSVAFCIAVASGFCGGTHGDQALAYHVGDMSNTFLIPRRRWFQVQRRNRGDGSVRKIIMGIYHNCTVCLVSQPVKRYRHQRVEGYDICPGFGQFWVRVCHRVKMKGRNIAGTWLLLSGVISRFEKPVQVKTTAREPPRISPLSRYR
jgi:hypothetical protein